METKIKWVEKEVSVDELIPADYNPRSISDEQLSNLRDSLDEYGQAQAVACNTDLTVIGGHQRLKAAKILGWKTVKVVVPDRKLSELECKDLNVRFNGITGSWEHGLLQPLLNELENNEFDVKLTGLKLEPLLLDDFENDGFMKELNELSDNFSVTFVFNKEHQENIEKYINVNGKDSIVAKIIELCGEESA